MGKNWLHAIESYDPSVITWSTQSYRYVRRETQCLYAVRHVDPRTSLASLISWLTINPKRLNILRQAGVYRAWHFTPLGILPCSFPRPWNTNRNSNNIYQETRLRLQFSSAVGAYIAEIILFYVRNLFASHSNDHVDNKIELLKI